MIPPLPIIASTGDVVDSVRVLNSKRPSHAATVALLLFPYCFLCRFSKHDFADLFFRRTKGNDRSHNKVKRNRRFRALDLGDT